ncbi:transposase [Myxococcus sp. AM011]|uniref:IS66 family transposase n=1 Tax=Myxococcus sp. AM011 TaxID=2745200 RepID=UPI0034CD32FB
MSGLRWYGVEAPGPRQAHRNPRACARTRGAQVHLQETLVCPCGAGILTAPAPKAIEQGQYGPGFLAHVVTAKCCDSIPLYRQAKALARAGMPVARTTLCDVFHEVGRATAPLAERLLALGRKNYLFVGNDEAGRNLAGLSSLVATCEANGVNPEAYLADVLMRLGSHPVSPVGRLLKGGA